MAWAEWRDVKLADLASEIERELTDKAEPLHPARIPGAVIAEMLPSGDLILVDGYHRTAGILRWARDSDHDPKDVEVRVVVVHCQNDDDDVAAAADPGHPDHEAAIARLIDSAEQTDA